MIVRQFISWIKTAPAGERAEATRALARAWLISDLSEDDRAAAEGALLMLLDADYLTHQLENIGLGLDALGDAWESLARKLCGR